MSTSTNRRDLPSEVEVIQLAPLSLNAARPHSRGGELVGP
jgi:hypothetical protein